MSERLSDDLAAFALDAPVPEAPLERARIMLADALIAILSGRRLPAARRATGALVNGRPAEAGGGAREFSTLQSTSAETAAFVNGTLAHADETDDSHEGARMHPSASVVPTSLASAEVADAAFGTLLEAIVVGYDVGVALNMGAWPDPRRLRASRLSTIHIGGIFGSVGARLRIGGITRDAARTAFSYAVQHSGSCTSFLRDTEHIEKAVVIGGLPARSALFACELADRGFSGVPDPFVGDEGFFEAFGYASDPEVTRARLSSPGQAITETAIKRYPIGMPIVATCEAIERLTGGERVRPDSVTVELPEEKWRIVDDREMPDINLQHVVAVQLVVGEVDFAMLHDLVPVPDAVHEMRNRVTLVGTVDLDADRNGFGTTRIARVTMR